jgi:hypothetical protein
MTQHRRRRETRRRQRRLFHHIKSDATGVIAGHSTKLARTGRPHRNVACHPPNPRCLSRSCAADARGSPRHRCADLAAQRARASCPVAAGAMQASRLRASARTRHAARSGAAQGAVARALPPAPRGAAPLSAGPRAPRLRLAPALHPQLSARAVRIARRRCIAPPVRALFETLERGFANALRTLNDTDDLSAVRACVPCRCLMRLI